MNDDEYADELYEALMDENVLVQTIEKAVFEGVKYGVQHALAAVLK